MRRHPNRWRALRWVPSQVYLSSCEAAEKKLSVEALEAEKAANDGPKDVAAGAHALADKLRENGHGELAGMVKQG